MIEANDSVAREMVAHIRSALQAIERDEGVRVLFAAESGSRAWGFASPDSDYDVRFIYVHPRDWYLSISEARDVIERPLDDRLVDLAGWDLRKALRLFMKSNPAFYEWLTSRIVYVSDGELAPAARALFERHADFDVLAHAYHSIATGQLDKGEGSSAIKLKRYFYAVRPVLALQWLDERRTLPPMNLQQLMDGVMLPEGVRTAIEKLRLRKQTTPEFGMGARIPVLDDWLHERFATLAPFGKVRNHSAQQDALADADALFARIARL